MLEEKKMLLRVYSQNIDGLEQIAGVSQKKVVYAHGSLQWATCAKCKRKVSSDLIEDDIRKGIVARCRAPLVSNTKQSTTSPTAPMRESARMKRKRPRQVSDSTTEEDELPSNVCGGVMKPGVTFFGETLHDNVSRCLEADREKVDALVVIGTSLSV